MVIFIQCVLFHHLTAMALNLDSWKLNITGNVDMMRLLVLIQASQ